MPSDTKKRRNPRKRPSSSYTRLGKSSGRAKKPAAEKPPEKPEGPIVYPMNYAGPLRRLYAFMIDAGLLMMIIMTFAPVSSGILFRKETAVPDILFFFGYFVIPTIIWGRTPGKWVSGIVVVGADGRTPGPAAIPREMIGKFVSIIAGTLGLVWIVFDRKNQGWHDKIAGTYVVDNPYSGGPKFMKDFFNLGKKTDADAEEKEKNAKSDSSDND